MLRIVLFPLLALSVCVVTLLCLVWALNALWLTPVVALASWAFSEPKLTARGRTVLITGGSSGIGLATAVCAFKDGARVVIAARNAQKLASAKAEVVASGGDGIVETLQLDVTWPFEKLSAALAPYAFDVLVLSAGDSMPCEFASTTERDWESLLRLNVYGVAAVARAAAAGMMRRRTGQIVFVSSMAGQTGIFGFSACVAIAQHIIMPSAMLCSRRPI
jgi:NAD(P)-dependent dehydrogenase (short-subunit alcohol dehydrogenase family)